MVRIDSSGNFLEDMNTMTTIDNEGNLRYIPMSGKNTQKKKKKDGILDNWVQAPQVFEDGYQFGDVSKTILGTGADIGLGIVQGIVAGGEGIGDLLTYGASGISRLAGNDELADQLKENAKINATEEIFGVVKNKTGLEKASVIGSKGDQVSNAIGTILTLTSTAGLGNAAGLGKTGQTLVSMGSMGASSVGSGMSEAYQGGATDEEAVKYGLISGAAEVGSEMLFGGLGRGAKAIGISQGLTGADDMLAKTISDKFKSQLAKNLAQYTVKAGAEGIEEVISGLAQAWGKKMTYMSEEDLAKLIQDEQLLDQFIVGMVSSGLSQAPGLVKTTSKGQDFLTGYTQNEQKVYNALLQERINEAQSESEKPLTKKQINAIEEDFKQDFENGNISTKKIEEVLGYEDIYNNLKDTTENALAKTLTAEEKAGIREEAKQEYAKRIKDDEFIKKNYYEDTQRTKAYNVDVNQYDKKYRGTIQKAIDSGILNNSTKTHQFVDFISKLAADKGVTFDFTNNEALKNSSLGIDGATVNGYVNANGDITLNINSAKSLNSVVGHEITHVLEGSDLYQALSDSLKEYAETKGEYAKRYNELQELYKNVEGADITKELNADLVGDYLFTNQEFINHLTQNRNLFQRIYDEIKYLVKQATAGSKEQRQLNKAMKMFEKAYKDNSVNLAEKEASTQPKYSITQDSNGRELTEQQQEYFKDSKVRDENGNLKVMYHGTPTGGFNIFELNHPQRDVGFLGKGFYFTSDVEDADEYSKSFDIYDYTPNSEVKEVYLNIKNPYIIPTDVNYTSDMLAKRLGVRPEQIQRTLINQGYDGIIYDANWHNEYVVFNSNQIKNVDNTNPSDNPDIRYSLSENNNLQDKINSSMTMAEAKKMIDIAFKENKINDWQEDNEKYKDADDWLNKVGIDEVAMYIENSESTILNYLNPLYDKNIGYGDDFVLEDILESYVNNELVGSSKPKANRLDLTKTSNIQDDRFYSPQTIDNITEVYNTANQRVTNSNRDEVYKARGEFVILAHNQNNVDELGLSSKELNQTLKKWSAYSNKALELSNRLNENVAYNNKWSGLENSSILYNTSVSNEELSSLVKNIEGDSSNWQRKYITSTMLALDTHIDYKNLSFEFDKANDLAKEHALGDYNRRTKTIRIGNAYQNTVAHEMGHYLDNKWAEDFGFLETSNMTDNLNFNTNDVTDDVKQFAKNFKMFIDDLVKSATSESTNNVTYYQNRGETFARFVGRFVEWTKNTASDGRFGYEDKYYHDNFTQSQYEEFVKLLQEKSMLDTTGQTYNKVGNENENYSLSQQNEDIAPTGNYNVYGEDIALQQTAPIRQDLVDLQNDIAAIKEDYRKQSEDIKKELQLLRQEREEIDRGVNEVAPIDEYTPVESDIAPYESEIAYPNTNVVPLDDKLLNKYKKYFKENFYFKGKQLDNAMEGIKELSANPELTQNDVYKYFKENFGKEETKVVNDALNELKSDLRYTEIGVSDEVKKDIAHRYDGFGNFRKKNFGKMKLVEYNGKNGVDQVYSDLIERFPGTVDSDIINPADQLVALSELANYKGYDTFFSEQPDEIIRAYANEMYSMIKDFRNETNQKLAEEQIPLSYLEEIAPTQEEETIDDYYNNLNEKITNLETELENIPKREYYDIQSREMDKRLSERIEPENRDILDLINQENSRKAGKKVELTKPVIAKEKGTIRSGIDTLKTMFINANAEIDNLAKESGNKMIKIAGDMLNNYSAEAQNDITTAQTDNYGNAIGKSVQQLFELAKDKGLEAQFNDYLINYSNIDRWARGKGSQTPLDVSQRLVANYESKYPEFKRWAKDVWKYAENVRNNWLESGMITQNMYKTLSEAYPHYVPYISDTNNFDATMDKMNELKARPIKKAIGGATELYPVEEALTRYTFAQKRAYRTNELYKQIYNTLQTNPGQRGAEVGEGYFTGEEPNLYRDDSGNYITAVIDGEERRVQISDDLFKALRNDMQTQVKDLEKRLSLITKPLQTFSNIRRKMLTSWRPSFALRNPIKDIQDAFFNSKHTKQMAKNYIPGIVELVKNSTPEVKQFKALYGEGNLMGTFENESGLYETKKGLKNNKFLKGLSSVNEIMELAPRYAEFKASLQAGESVEEAMYNAREVTTNFSRGGVITKALNRNGFTFLNASVQGFDKFIRNFSGENGAKGIANSLLKAVALGVTPAIFNELAFGIDDDKDEEYEALPDYIKDNYYIIKIGDGNFLRIPKGRILSVFGSAARRTIELAEGEENAFEGYLSNANSQIGINNPEENNIFAPFLQAFGSENGTAWYGGDIVPSRLQDKPVEEQYDASTDKMSIWLGSHLGVSPYKINYLIDQYSGGIGDLLLPYITDEAKNKGGFIAPIVSEFTTDSTTNNKYVSDFYSKNDELKVKANSSKATDSDLVKNQYMYSVSKQMSELYAERRKVQENNSLTKEQKYEKAQAIKKEINKLAKEGLDTYESGTITGNYAEVGNQEFYKNAKGKWTDVSETDKENINSLGLNNRERDSYFKTSNELYNIDQRYKNLTEGATDEEKTQYNAQRKVDVINAVKSANLPDEGKAALYDKKYADTDTLNAVLDCNIDFDSYLDLQAQNFTADKDKDGKSISGSKKAKVYGYINSMNMPYEQKIMLAKLEYKGDNTYNNEIIGYLNNDPTINYQDMKSILKAMGMKVDEYGNITW